MFGRYEPSDRRTLSEILSNNVLRRSTSTQNSPLQSVPNGSKSSNNPPSPIQGGKAKHDRFWNYDWRQAFRGRLSRYWIWEFLASVFSMVCLATIVVVLLYEDGKRLDQWALMISPNAVISFIAALAKSSCIVVLAEVIGQLRWMHFAHQPRELRDLQIYDEASRGPWGAMKLILRSKNAAFLASCASVLTVAALLIDPFSQLVLTFPSRATATNEQIASIRTADVFDAHTASWETDDGAAAVPQNAPFHLQSAIISAVFGVDPPFQISCPTSNCTFSSVTTLGVCSTCRDVMPVSNTDCTPTVQGSISCNTTVSLQTLPSVPFAIAVANDSSTAYDPQYPSNTGESISPVQFSWALREDSKGAYGIVWNSSSQAVLTADPVYGHLAFRHPAVFGAFIAMRVDDDIVAAFPSMPTAPSQLTQCMLTYCAKTYEKVEVRKGETHIGSINNIPLTIAPEDYPAEYRKIIMSAPINGTSTNFTMNLIDFLNIGQYVEDVFSSSVSYTAGTLVPGPGGNMAPTFGLAMYKTANLTAMMENIADSMTNSMRTAQDNLTTVEGSALVNETYIHIEWKWLALPVVVAVLSLVLLIIVMTRSHARGTEAWKSSTLPLLFYDLEGWSQSDKKFDNEVELMQMSKNMKGQLSLDKNHRVFERENLSLRKPPATSRSK